MSDEELEVVTAELTATDIKEGEELDLSELETIGEIKEELESNDDDSEDNEIVLADSDGQQAPKKTKNDYIFQRFASRRNKLQDENAALKQEVERLAESSKKAQVLLPPDESDFDDPMKYRQAKAKYDQDLINNAIAGQLEQQQNGHRVAAQQQQEEKAFNGYAESASKLGVSDFNDSQDKAIDVLGEDFSRLIVQSLPDEAAKLMYWFGKNPEEAARYRDDYTVSPGTTTFNLGKLAGKLTIQKRKSSAAQPESKVKGGKVGANQDWQKEYDKIMDTATPDNSSKVLSAVRELKTKARAAGFDVSTLR